MLELLQDGVSDPGGEEVAREQQYRQPVDRGQCGAGDHVGRARADRRGAGQGRQAVTHPGERHCGMDHSLLVAGLAVDKRTRCLELGLQQRLAQAGDVPVAKNPEAAFDQTVLLAVALAVCWARNGRSPGRR